ncbi:hypothetical protein [Peptoniphilus senegalensis]|uniref:hypothetical protein n=1 Tax=Peptoniphilus senegalensis TaxID=1465757 RepID=UPI0003080F1B|nr:hypothetical protein [Peptoniphilus senegalensis]
MLTIILILLLIIAVFQWLSNNMALKGTLYLLSLKYGEQILDDVDIKESIKTAIGKTLEDIFYKNHR